MAVDEVLLASLHPGGYGLRRCTPCAQTVVQHKCGVALLGVELKVEWATVAPKGREGGGEVGCGGGRSVAPRLDLPKDVRVGARCSPEVPALPM